MSGSPTCISIVSSKIRRLVHFLISTIPCTQHVQSGLKSSEEVGKSDASPVTVADFGAQAIVAWSLQKESSDLSLVAEETSSAIKGPEFQSMRVRITQLVNSFIPGDEVLTEADVMDLIGEILFNH